MYRGGRQWSEPVIGVQTPEIGGAPVLDFGDLMELRFLDQFRTLGIGWQTIRLAAARAKEVLNSPHPFSSQRFVVDGRTILAEMTDEAGDRHLLDLVQDQWAILDVVMATLRQGLHYDGGDQPLWWSPLGEDRHVVLHPGRCFGAPAIVPNGIRTSILYQAYLAEGGVSAVAEWYNVAVGAVEDAVTFETGLRAAA